MKLDSISAALHKQNYNKESIRLKQPPRHVPTLIKHAYMKVCMYV